MCIHQNSVIAQKSIDQLTELLFDKSHSISEAFWFAGILSLSVIVQLSIRSDSNL